MAKRHPIITFRKKRRPAVVFSVFRPPFLFLLLSVLKWIIGPLTRLLNHLLYLVLRLIVDFYQWFTAPWNPNKRQLKQILERRATKKRQVVFFFRRPTVIASLVVTGLLLVSTSVWTYIYVLKDLPSPREVTLREQSLTTRILDRNGTVLYRIYEDENRTLISLDQVPPALIQATIAIEDQDFYYHRGFSVAGIVRAIIANYKGDLVQGGSTITQQLVKNRLLSREKTFQRKIKELLLSIMVERIYTKDEILEMYLNQLAYGGSTYGIEEASHRYFNKSATQLTLAESALLAGLPQSPSNYSPFGPNPDLAQERQAEVLRRMVEDTYITAEQASQAKQETLVFRTDTIDIEAPHFVMYVKKLLAETYGEEVVNKGGLEVTTSLDLELQTATQKQVTDEVTKLTRLNITNGAALVTNPQTGEILSMVGSTNYFNFDDDGQVNVTIRPRQPGSSIKPLTYALALEKGMNPSSRVDDSPTTFQIAGSKPYSPKNYDGRFHGSVTLREALGSSYNIPAVKLLASVGINTFLDRAEKMGISTWKDRTRYGLSITLGGGEILMTDMAEVYGTFANYGETVDLNPFLEIKNQRGEVLYRNTCALDKENCARRRTLDTRVAYQITDMLKDNQARTPAFGPRSVLTIPNQEVAVKTGTTNSLRDNWTIGYTTDRVVAVWVGNNDNSPMSYVASGVTGASPIWNNIIRLVLDEAQPHRFPAPTGMTKVTICARTRTLPCKSCPALVDEYFTPGTEPKTTCTPADFFKPSSAPTKPSGTPPPNRDRILNGATISP